MDCRRDDSKADFAWIFEYHVQPKQIGIAWVIDSFPTYLSRLWFGEHHQPSACSEAEADEIVRLDTAFK